MVEDNKPSGGRRVSVFLGKVMLILLETILLLSIALYGLLFVLAKGPSPTARDLFVRSVRETSAVGFLADLYFTEEEIAAIEGTVEEVYEETDTSLITISDSETTNSADPWGLIDEDGDGIILEEVKGEGYTGYMMVVLDPSRVILGTVPESYGVRGYTVEEMCAEFDAVAGINAGGFFDENGRGNGSAPITMVAFEGKVYYPGMGSWNGFAGIDDNHILHVAKMKARDLEEKNIQYGVGFGPMLIVNGEVVLPENNPGGLNPRTAIGQRSDGAMLLLVVDGRQAYSIGCTLRELCDIFLEYGAVNAYNLDGGSSTLMWYEDRYVNNCASVVGIRPVPTTFIVLKEGVAKDE